MIFGEYNSSRYTIFNDTTELYVAGNHPLESSEIVPVDQGVGLVTMRKFCKQTAKMMAKERGEEFGGIERVDED